MRRFELNGPPWGGYVDPDEAYVRAQASSAGSGLLGGWSQGGYGGSYEAQRGLEKEIREAIAELVRARAPLPATPSDEARPSIAHAA